MGKIIEIIEIIIGIMMLLGLILGTIAVIVEKIKTGRTWIGQGYGRK